MPHPCLNLAPTMPRAQPCPNLAPTLPQLKTLPQPRFGWLPSCRLPLRLALNLAVLIVLVLLVNCYEGYWDSKTWNNGNFDIMLVLWAETSNKNLLGQGGLKQFWVSMLCPWQSSPPWAGAGLVHVLVLVWVPPPQVAEHSDHSGSFHPPSTKMKTWFQKLDIIPCIERYSNFTRFYFYKSRLLKVSSRNARGI